MRISFSAKHKIQKKFVVVNKFNKKLTLILHCGAVKSVNKIEKLKNFKYF